MSELLRNTYTLAAAIVLVCSLGSFGGVSLYIIQKGFADQREIMARLNDVENRTLKAEIQIIRLEKDIGL